MGKNKILKQLSTETNLRYTLGKEDFETKPPKAKC